MIDRMKIAAIAGLLTVGGVAHAATVDTPSLWFNLDSINEGIVVNGTDKPIEFEISKINQDGNVSHFETKTAAPHGIVISSHSFSDIDVGFCRVEGKFPKRKVKVTFCTGTFPSICVGS